jgi:hypothetical protein
LIFGPEKYVAIGRPVVGRNRSWPPSAESWFQILLIDALHLPRVIEDHEPGAGGPLVEGRCKIRHGPPSFSRR